MILGYDAHIPQGFWKRVVQYHVPVKWFACWVGLVVTQIALGLLHLPLPGLWTLGLGIVVALLELVLLQWLTWAHPQWDSLLWHRDTHYYEAY
jgi:hypothetical protein